MSSSMLNDEDTINDINPFVVNDFSLPGAKGERRNFEQFKSEGEIIMEDIKEKSPMCDTISSSGWGAVEMCSGLKNPCALSRPLIPGRNIDVGFTEEVGTKYTKKKREKNINIIASVSILVILLLILRRYKVL